MSSSMAMYRRWQLWALEKNMLNIEHIVTSISDSAVFDKRDEGDGWNISEILGHLADTDNYFMGKAGALAENKEAPAPSGVSVDERVKEAGYAEQDARDLLETWKQVRVAYHATLSALPEDDEEVWQRPGTGFSLNDQIILSAYHDLDHLHQIVKIIRS